MSTALEIAPDAPVEEVATATRTWLEAHLPQEWKDAAALGATAVARVRDRLGTDWFETLGDSGLATPTWPREHGGLGLGSDAAAVIVSELARYEAGRPMSDFPGVALGGPTIIAWGSEEQKERFLRPLALGQDRWCQLFSEPGAGSDLAGLATRAVQQEDGSWRVTGQKVWTSKAHQARWALLLARTDPDLPKHGGLTYFVLDMEDAGVEVRPLRQMTGDADFNEVHLTGATIPDSHRLDEVGAGWRVAMTTLTNERNAIGGGSSTRGVGPIANALRLWRERPQSRTPVARDDLVTLFLRAEALRLTSVRYAAQPSAYPNGPEGSLGKLVDAELNQDAQEYCMHLLGPEATAFPSYDVSDDPVRRADVRWQFLRSRANTIEGGTAEVLRNILGERALGLPGDVRVDKGKPWKDVPRG